MIRRHLKKFLFVGVVTGYYANSYIKSREFWNTPRTYAKGSFLALPTREDHLNTLKTTKEFDIVVIGGGATGSGIALDAATRGLSVALIERDDFGAGTSSRSTKLLHGGVRYLEKAVKNLDMVEFNLVTEALHERTNCLRNAPHLCKPLPLMLPVTEWYHLPQFWVGLQLYDIIAGNSGLPYSYYMSKRDTQAAFPALNTENTKCSLVYYDGQFNDARMNVTIALTAAAHGATVVNHANVQSLIHKDIPALEGVEGSLPGKRVEGVVVTDNLTGETFNVKGKIVINSAGPFADYVRTADDPNSSPIIQVSSGAHIVLPKYFSSPQFGMIDPKTSDGRVIFVLPFQNKTLVGTTEEPTELLSNPKPSEAEIEFILTHMRHYLNKDLRLTRSDVLAAWSGIRPLSRDPDAANTAQVSRHHIVTVSKNGLLTVIGGKWTTYRRMAQDAVDRAIKETGLAPRSCVTERLPLLGAQFYTSSQYVKLIQDYKMDADIAQHLSDSYGDRASILADISQSGYSARLAPDLPYIEAEVVYSTNEYACTAVDVLARRTRLAFLDYKQARAAVPRIVDLMGEKLGWDNARKRAEAEQACEFLETFRG